MTKELKADLSLFSVTIFWGASFPIMSIALKDIPPFTFLFLRYFLSAVLMTPFVLKKLNGVTKKTIKASFLIGFSLLLGSGFQIVGLLYTSPGKSGFITGMNVVMVPVFIALLYKKLPDIKTLLGVVFSISGLYIMSINGSMGINFGDVLTFICAVFFAVQLILVDRLAEGENPVILCCLQLYVVGITAFFPAVFYEGLNFKLSLAVGFGILFTVIFCTCYAYIIQNKMQQYTNPSHAAIIFLAEPVFGALFSTFLGYNLTYKTLIGCVLILLGMTVINFNIKVGNEEKDTI